MALNSTQLDLIKLYMASFNRAPEKGGFDYWSSQLASGKSFAQVVDIVFGLGVVKAIYPDSMPDDAFLTLIYINIFNKLPDDEGLGFWMTQLGTGRTRSSLVLDMINAGLDTPDGTPGKDFIVNRYVVSQHAVEQQLAKGKEISIDTLKVITGSVTESAASVDAAKEAIDNDNSGGLRATTMPMTVAAAANGISPAEKSAGVAVVISLAGTNAVVGNIVELLINGASFPTPLSKTLVAADITASSVSVTIPSSANWGGDGEKLLTMRLKDKAGHIGPAGGGVTVVLDTTAPKATPTAVSVAAAANSISAAEKAAGVEVVVDLTGTNAAAGDTVEILIGGVAFSTAVTKILTAADITANSAAVTTASTSAWGVDGNKVLSARLKDAAGNVGPAGGSLTVTLDSTGPTGPTITIAAAANGISAAEETAGVAVVASLTGTSALAGDVMEVLLGGAPFSTPVLYTLTAADITAKSATATITNSAGWGGDGTKVITARLKDAAGNTGTEGKSVSVVLDTVTPGTPAGAITSAIAAEGINAAEKTLGVAVTVDLTGSTVAVGDIVELMIDGVAFTTPVTRTLTSGDINVHSATLTIGTNAGWGADGSKVLTARFKDAAGNASPAGGNLTVALDTSVPTAPTNPVAVAVAANGLNNAEKNEDVDVVVDLTGTGALAGDSVSILLNGAAFSAPATATLTSADIDAKSVTVTIPGTANWGANGSKVLTARVIDVAGNVGSAGGALTVNLDTAAPTVGTTPITYTDLGTTGISALDTFVLSFNEATDKAITMDGMVISNGPIFGTGATAVWDGSGTQLTVTLAGTLTDAPTIESGDIITLTGVADVAGNTADLTFTVTIGV